MNIQNLNSIVEQLLILSETNTANNKGASIAVSNSNIFKFSWDLDNNANSPSDRTISVNNIEEAVYVVSKFSGRDSEYVKSNLVKSNLDESQPMFLHFFKTI